jgi:hypothetical protein
MLTQLANIIEQLDLAAEHLWHGEPSGHKAGEKSAKVSGIFGAFDYKLADQA